MGAVLLLAGCAQVDAAKLYGLKAAEYYCTSDEVTRQALREQVTTDKGPVIQVNCDNLPDPI